MISDEDNKDSNVGEIALDVSGVSNGMSFRFPSWPISVR